MSTASTSASGWTESSLRSYQKVVAPFFPTVWNKLDKALTTIWGRVAHVVALVVSLGIMIQLATRIGGVDVAGDTLRPADVPWALGTAVVLALILFSPLFVADRAAKEPEWKAYPVWQFRDRWPIRLASFDIEQAILRYREDPKHRGAEFQIEFLEPRGLDPFPPYCVLWMRPDLDRTTRTPVLMTYKGSTVFPPPA